MKKFILIIILCFIYTACSEQTRSIYKNTNDTLQSDAPMYDVMGRQVDATYRCIIIQNGNKYLLK